MYFKSIEIENYKSFWKNQEIKLEQGFNLFIGANNSGKTTALEALDINISTSEPHRSINSIPIYGSATTEASKFKVTIATDIDEYARLVGRSFYLPISPNLQFVNDVSQKQYFDKLVADSQFEIFVEYGGGIGKSIFKFGNDISQESSIHHHGGGLFN